MASLKERVLRGPSWEESLWAYYLATWRCVLFGHKFGPAEEEYEDIYHVGTYRVCERSACGFYEQTWSAYDEPPQTPSPSTGGGHG